MPTYEYACLTCGMHVEVFQRFSDEPLVVCGACGGPLRKVFYPAGILFKGSGFYATDSRSSSRSKASPARDGGREDAGSKAATSKGSATSEPAGGKSGSSTTADTSKVASPGKERSA